MVTHVGRGMYLVVIHASHLKRAEFQRSLILGVLLYLCLLPLTSDITKKFTLARLKPLPSPSLFPPLPYILSLPLEVGPQIQLGV